MIPNDFVQSLLARVDIVEVIDRLVPLKKAGANYVACCPFHKEKSPSFSVSPTKQFYHCFGCGAHGTAIGFLMEYSGKTFPEAVEDLARDVGLTVPQVHAERDKPASPDNFALMQTVARFYRAQLRETPSAIAYLKQRGLTGEIAARYGIGYAPKGWQALEQALPDYRDAALDALGLVAQKEDRRYDYFRHRIMFPIHDARGRTIAFGGRVIDNDDKPKYLNSPETPLFSKGNELYGLFQARDAIRRQGCVIVVEGYMDVVALAQHGIDYCVATLGTATTPTHTQKLYRLTDNVIFCFDGDNAGRQAAWRALVNTLPTLQDGKRASFLFLPDGLDPDDFVRQRGRAAFEDALTRAMPLSEFLLAEKTAQNPPHNAEGRAALIHALQPLLASVTAPALAALLRRRLAELTQLPESELRVLLSQRPSMGKPATKRASSSGGMPMIPERNAPFRAVRRAPSLVRELLQAVVQQPELARQQTIPLADERSPEALALNEVARYCRDSQAPLSVAGVIQQFAGTPHQALIAEMLAAAEAQALPPELVASQFDAALARWKQQLQQRETAALLQTPLSQLSEEQRERLAQMRREEHKTAPPAKANTESAPKPEYSAARLAHHHATHPREKEPSLFVPDDDTPPF